MRGTGKFLAILTFIGGLLLLYVHAQISLFQVSYTIDSRSRQLAQQSEEYRLLKFEVEQLKAPRLLETRMKELQMDLTLPKEVRIVRVPTVPVVDAVNVQGVSLRPLSDGILDFLGRWVKVAQAKTDN
jgi:hypothetical protein